MGFFRPGRARSIVLAMLATLLVCTVYLYWTPTTASSTVPVVPSTAFEVPIIERQKDFWKVFHPLLTRYDPNCPPPANHGDAPAVHFNPNEGMPRPDLSKVTEECMWLLEGAHDQFVKEITKPGRDLNPVHSHTPGTRGIVTAAGSLYMPVFVNSLRMLRRAGSSLPVEVYMKDTDEYEKHICQEVLPDMNARCLVMGDVVGKEAIEHYQLKSFAILFSSFEEVIWMDADCFPLDKPEDLLDSEPYTSTGLVTWPDFWFSSASPLFYQVSKQPVPPMTSRPSTEAGVILVSKKTHFLPLLLAAYYNFYGPSQYYRLLTQGGPGEGDKETFIAAASALKAPFYTVSERVRPIGHFDDIHHSGSGMAQADPREDYALTSQGKWRINDPSVAPAPPVFFIHANYPKFNPGVDVFGTNWETTPTIDENGTDVRAWSGPPDVIERLGFDVEKAFWEEIKYNTCKYEMVFESWKDKAGLCQKVEEYWNNVFAEPHENDPKFTQDG
ncbi:hypothetical protein PENDEC_c009G04841 [Penicillium decumbens]|uniref:Alpha-1,2-mannosyltransferase n=1 Tax=Penicillium decumbens TaxID=69771 RepID=A0A1V6PDN3_PENDC|nr:hypothetical protein PENDEC_c009G04841 [Penicillium decumbens]